MSVVEAIILGLIQGFTEFIPISSSGHLVIAQFFFSGGSDHLFLEFINIGTVLALIIYFWSKIISILKQIFTEGDYRLARNILITALPAGAVGFFAADFITGNGFFGNIWVVVIMLALVGVVMVVLERLPKASPVKDGGKLTIGRALAIGFAQILALIPGTSRSGSTIIAGRLLGLKPAAAAEYSFLVSIPIMLGLILKVLVKEGDRAYLFDNLTPLIAGNIAALISGLIAVGFLMRYLANHNLSVFGWYRIGLAALLAVILLV
jgi:undecaprenyl-diphosphatase